MMDPFSEEYETEVFENVGCEVRLLPDDREQLEQALSDSLEILNAPGDTEPDRVLRVVEVLEELHPYFPDTSISDRIGEMIELLHEISDERVLDFEAAQEGKREVEALALALGIEVADHEI